MPDESQDRRDASGDPDRSQLARTRERRFLIAVFAALLVPLPVAAVVGFVLLGDRDTPVTATDLLLLVALTVVPVVLIAIVFVLARRKVWWLKTSPGWALSWRDRRRILKVQPAAGGAGGQRLAHGVVLRVHGAVRAGHTVHVA